MANEEQFGGTREGFEGALERMAGLAEAAGELDAKVGTVTTGVRGNTGAFIDNIAQLDRAIAATRELSQVTGSLSSALVTETNTLRQNTAAWIARVEAMGEATAAGRGLGGKSTRTRTETAVAETTVAEATVAPRQRRPIVNYEAEARAAAGLPPVTAADTRARAAVERARQEEMAAAIGRVQAQYVPGPVYQRGIDEALGRTAAPRPVVASGPLPGAAGRVEAASRGTATAAPHGGETVIPVPESAARAATEFEGLAAAQANAAKAAAEVAAAEQAAAADALRLAEAQAKANAEYKASVAAYAESSTALSRHGALTTEFIGAFARGDVTLKEFTSQMTATIGKFGGWAVAGAAVYGAYDAVKKLGRGAKDTQEGIQNLSRFIPSVANGSQRAGAEQTFRDLSTQLNVPIGEVTSAMTVMARVFHNVADAGEATRAVLLASRLDQIPQAQSEQYLTGVAQSLGQTGPGGGKFLVGVVDSLNALQNRFGARVNQTLPALARATPAAVAGGLVTIDPRTGKPDTSLLEGLVAAGVRSGIPGSQVGTALLRSVGTFAFRPVSQDTFRNYGITATPGDYAGLIKQIEARVSSGTLSRTDEGNLAQALGGPLQGTRVLLPIVRQLGGQVQAYQQTAAHPQQTAQEELGKVLGGVGEQAKRLGVELENIGSELESAGLLQPVQVALQAIGLFGHGLEVALTPISHLTQVVNDLSSGGRKVIGVLALLAGAAALRSTRFGGVVESGLSRVPGFGGLDNTDRRIVQRTLGDYRSLIVPQTTKDLESQRRQYLAATSAADSRGKTAGRLRARADRLRDTEGFEGADESATAAEGEFTAARERATSLGARQAETLERLAQQTALVELLESDQATLTEKANYLLNERLALLGGVNSALRAEVESLKGPLLADAKAAPSRGGGGNQDRAGLTPGEGAIIGGVGVAGAVAAGRVASEGNVAEEAFTQADPAAQRAAAAEAAEFEQKGTLRNAMTEEAPPPLQFGPQTALSRTGARATSVADHPFGLLIASQLLNGVLPGSLGDTVGNIGSVAAMGAFLSGTGIFGGLAQGATRLGARGLNRLPGVNIENAGLSEGTLSRLNNPLLGVGIATAASGATTPGTAGLLGAVGGGVATGATIGTIIGPEGTLLGGAIGAIAGGLSGFAAHELLAPTPKHLSARAQALQASLNALPQQVGTAGEGQIAAFGNKFADVLQRAYNNGDQVSAQKQQQEIAALIPHFTQLLSDAGVTSRTGVSTQGYLEQVIAQSSTSEAYQKNPAAVGQVIATAGGALLGADSSQFQSQLSRIRRPGDFLTAIAQERERIVKQRGAAREAVPGLRAERQSAQSLINADPTTPVVAGVENLFGDVSAPVRDGVAVRGEQRVFGLGPVATRAAAIKKLQEAVSDDGKRLASARQLMHGLDTKGIQQVQQDAASALQGVQQQVSDVTNLATAQAGGNRLQQIAAQVRGANRNLLRVQRFRPFLSHADFLDAERQGQAQRDQLRTQRTQQSATELQARQSQQLSTIDQATNPVQYARQAAENARKYLAYVRSHASAFDVSDLKAAIGNVATANFAVRDAIFQNQSALASAYEQLSEANHPADQSAVAGAQLRLAQRQIALTRNRPLPERLAAQAQRRAAQNAQAEANRSAADTNYQIQQAQQAGDPVAQALTGIAQARHDLATALGPDEVRAARLELANANTALHQAEQDQITALGALQASTVNDPVRRDSILLATARRKLAQAVKDHLGEAVIRQDRTDVNTQALQRFNDGISNQLANLDYLQSTLQISAQDHLAQLQKLAERKGLSPDQKRQIGSAIYGIETSSDNTSLFNLAPAGQGVRVPTIFDAATAAARERQRLGRTGERKFSHHEDGLIGTAHDMAKLGGASIKTRQGALATSDLAVERAITHMHHTLARGAGAPGATVGQIIVNVGAGEVAKVADVLDRTLGTRVHARMRAAGVRGTN